MDKGFHASLTVEALPADYTTWKNASRALHALCSMPAGFVEATMNLNRRPVGTPVFVTHDGQEDVSDLEAIGAVFRKRGPGGPGGPGEPALVATHSSLRAFRNTAESTDATLQMHSKQQNFRNHRRQLGAEHALSDPTKRENSVQSAIYGAIKTDRKAAQQQQQQPRTSNTPRPKKTRGAYGLKRRLDGRSDLSESMRASSTAPVPEESASNNYNNDNTVTTAVLNSAPTVKVKEFSARLPAARVSVTNSGTDEWSANETNITPGGSGTSSSSSSTGSSSSSSNSSTGSSSNSSNSSSEESFIYARATNASSPATPTATPPTAPTYHTSPTSRDDFVDMLIAMHGDFFVFNPLSTFSWTIFVIRSALGLDSAPRLKGQDIYFRDVLRPKADEEPGLWVSWESIQKQCPREPPISCRPHQQHARAQSASATTPASSTARRKRGDFNG